MVGGPSPRTVQWVAIGLFTIAIAGLLAVQWVPWHAQTFGEDDEFVWESSLWSVSFRDPTEADEVGWWDEEANPGGEPEYGVQTLKGAAITVTTALGLSVVALVLALLDTRWIAGVAALLTMAVLITGIVFYESGMEVITEGLAVDASIGFVLAVVSTILLGLSGLAFFLPHPGLRVREGIASWVSAARAEQEAS